MSKEQLPTTENSTAVQNANVTLATVNVQIAGGAA